jgi:hypothetical protein
MKIFSRTLFALSLVLLVITCILLMWETGIIESDTARSWLRSVSPFSSYFPAVSGIIGWSLFKLFKQTDKRWCRYCGKRIRSKDLVREEYYPNTGIISLHEECERAYVYIISIES